MFVKIIQKQFLGGTPQRLSGKSNWFALALVLVAALVLGGIRAQAQSFASPIAISGVWGSNTVDNSSAVADPGSPSIAGFAPTAPVWFQWTAPKDGDVQLDTIGSVDSFFGFTMDTVVGVFTGTNVARLDQVAANDDLYPNLQLNYTGQNIYDTNSHLASSLLFSFYQPYSGGVGLSGGSSGLHFNAKAGTTYYFVVDSKFLPGFVSLQWAYHSSGVFRFATENIDQTGLVDANGNQMLLYQCAETEASRRTRGTVNTGEYDSTFFTYYSYNVPGLLVTVTRVAGSSGRALVQYTTQDGDTNSIMNGDVAAVAGVDYTARSGTLVFDDYEMSKTIWIPIIDSGTLLSPATYRPNRDFFVVLTNVQNDLLESPDVSSSRLDPTYYQAVCRILDVDIDPRGESTFPLITTNEIVTIDTNMLTITNLVFTTNTVYSPYPTNAVFNFQKVNYRVPRDVQPSTNSAAVTIYVNRSGTNQAAASIFYRVNNYFLTKSAAGDEQNIYFPLQPGSDYATPTPARFGLVRGTNSDFESIGGESGTLAWGARDFDSKPIKFNIPNDHLTKFNKDFHIELYDTGPDANDPVLQVGMVAETTVTILTDDRSPPAGSVDEYYNANFGLEMAPPISTVPPQMVHPGTDGEVYGLAVDANDKTIIVGRFYSYDLSGRNCIARINTDGSLDTSFNPETGVDPFDSSIQAVSLTSGNQVVIGGDFVSYNGTQRNSIARLNSDGSLDFTFDPGAGANGPVYALIAQSDGKVLIGGDFTSFNGTTRNYIARLNADGSLDTAFDPQNNLNAPVYTMAASVDVPGANQIAIGGDFTSVGGVAGQDHIARILGDGSVDTTFDPGAGANGTVYSLAQQTDGKVVIGGEFSVVNGQNLNRLARLTSNGSLDTNFFVGIGADSTVYHVNYYTNSITTITVSTNGSIITTNVQVTGSEAIYVGGKFTAINGTHRLGFARLNDDGTVDTTFLDTAYNQFAGLPRLYFGDTPGAVFTSGVQSDGKVMIGGAFNQVGGGQFDPNVRPEDFGFDFNTFTFLNQDIWPEPKTRDGIRNRSNIARLIGGATPGPGNISLLYDNYSVNKSQAAFYVSLIRTNGTLGPASANFSVRPGLAQSGVDYIYNSAAPLYWIAWEYLVSLTRMHSDGLFGINTILQDIYGSGWVGFYPSQAGVTVTLLNNALASGDQNGQFQLANPSGADQFYLGGQNIPLGLALGRSASPLTIIDDHHDSGAFGFSSPSYTANSSNATINVNRTGGTYGNVSLNYATTTSGSTAILNSDYRAASGTLNFGNGQTNRTFNVQVLNTNYISSVEKTVNLKLFNLQPPPKGNASLVLSNAVLRIINPNFQGFLNFTTNLYRANLSAGSISLTVSRIVGSKGTLTVQCGTFDDTAVNGVDYVGATNTLQWNSGDVSPQTISIPLINGGAISGSKQFRAFLFNPQTNGVSAPFLLGTVTNTTLVINNDNSYGTFQFSAPGYVVNELGGHATLTVTRTGSSLGTASVDYATADFTAFAATNYIATTGTLTFAPGQTVTNFTVSILDDGVQNPPPSGFYFSASLSNPSAGATLGSLTNVPVDIVDIESYNRPPGSPDGSFDPSSGMNDDVLALALQSNGQIIAGGNFTVVSGIPENHIARLNGDGTLDNANFLNGLSGANGPVRALVSQTDDRVVLGGSFTFVNGVVRNYIARLNIDGSLDTSFNPGSGANNTIYTLAETFIGSARGIYVGGDFTTINGSSSHGVARLNDHGTVDASFDTGIGASGAVYALAVYSTNSVHAGKVLVGGTFTNFNGFILNHIARLNVNGSVDTNFVLNLGANDAVRAIAIQNDGAVLIGGDFTDVNGTAVNRIARLNPDGTLDATFTSNAGAGANDIVNAIALQTDNRIVLVGDFTQANGVTRSRITRLMPDGTLDPTINFGDGANGAIEALIIQPNDQMLVIGGAFTQFQSQAKYHIARIFGGSVTGSGAFEFTSAGYQVGENGVSAVIKVRRTGATSGPNPDGSGDISVDFATSDVTAQAGINYVGVTNSLVFPPGEVLKTMFIPVMNDSNITANLTVNLTLSNPTPPAGLGDQPTAVLTIINVDIVGGNPRFKFSSSTYTVSKSGVSATITVLRTGFTNNVASVNFATTNGTAIAGQNYVSTNGTLVFINGVTSNTFSVVVIDNSIPQPDKTVLLQLFNPTNGSLTAPSTATLTIFDASGSLVIPAGSALISESGPVNGIIDPNETVTMSFAFRVAGGTNVSNLRATLLAANGITSPSTNGPQSYGPLTVYGPSVSRNFTFTATGTNAQQIAATFNLLDETKNLGQAVFNYTLGQWTKTFSNPAAIIINNLAIATPYPSIINVSNMGSVFLKATVTLTNLTHTSVYDVDALVVAPNQKDTLIMSHVGTPGVAANHITLTFDDAATNSLPPTGAITTGTNKPTAYPTLPVFP
jgi:uncharacterized delta-60 repeat protein